MRPCLKEESGEEERREKRDEGRNIWGGGERKKQLHGRSDIPELRRENCAADRKSIDSMIYGM